ncbi:hypothetical protein KC19_VG218700 [Ceratodon purpureus]|uniref:Uncharacterized protein n=1 Tax=Ceratodon purpureus TaxID=3225 RepID=A0A8T0HTS7_CERPU|nr:hypothetical protein KC19_VG218700 [Ceratodon purpureus]
MSLTQPPRRVDASPNIKFESSESMLVHEEHPYLIEGTGCWKGKASLIRDLKLTRNHVFLVLLLKHISRMVLHSYRCYSIV